jgi:hypothetical protein
MFMRGPLPACCFPADHFEITGFLLDFEHRDAVVTKIRGVEKSPAWRMDANFSGGVGPDEVRRQCRNRLLPDHAARTGS